MGGLCRDETSRDALELHHKLRVSSLVCSCASEIVSSCLKEQMEETNEQKFFVALDCSFFLLLSCRGTQDFQVLQLWG